MAAALAASMPPPCPSMSDLLAAGEALQTLLEQPMPIAVPANAIFLVPYSPTLASLPPATLLALLRVHHLAALPAPTPDTLSACLAQRYASLPPAQFEAEVGAHSPHWATAARGWYEARFGMPPAQPSPLCFCAQIVSCSRADPLPTLSFGLLHDSPPAEFWARGLACPSSQPPTTCAALLSLTMGHAAWLHGSWPAAGTAADCVSIMRSADSPSTRYTALTSLLSKKGPGCAVLAHLCCMLLWGRAEDCPARVVKQATEALTSALCSHTADACIVHSSCAAVARLACIPTDSTSAMLWCLPALIELLLRPTLLAAAKRQAAAALVSLLSAQWDPGTTAGSVAQLAAIRLVDLLEEGVPPLVQLAATRRLNCMLVDRGSVISSAFMQGLLGKGALKLLVRLVDNAPLSLREQAVLLLGSMLACNVCTATEALLSGVVPGLLRVLQPYSSASLVRSATLAVRNLAAMPGLPLAAALPLLSRLAALLTAPEPCTQEHAVWALGNLCSGRVCLRQAILETACLPALVALLGGSSPTLSEMRTSILSTLLSLVKGDRLRLLTVLGGDCLPCIAGLLLRRGRVVQCELACTLLTMASTGGHYMLQSMIDAGGVAALLRAARTRRSHLRLKACWALAAVAYKCSRQQVQWLVSQGGVEAISSSLGLSAREGAAGGESIIVHGLEAMLQQGVPPERLAEAGVREGLQRVVAEGKGEVVALAGELGRRLQEALLRD